MDILYESFYHNKDGTYTGKYGCIGDCLSRNVFFILRNILNRQGKFQINDLYKAYLEDLNFYLIKNDLNNITGIGLNDILFWNKLICSTNTTEFIGDEKKAIEELEKLLNKGEVVLVSTGAEKIKFHKDFHLDIKDEDKGKRKINFLALYNSQDFLYYLYTYTLCNREYFKACDENPSIGIAPMNDFYNSFHDYVRLSTINPDLGPLNDVCDNVYNSIYKSIENYYCSNQQNAFILSGRKGLEFILEKLRGDGLSLDSSCESCFENSASPFSFESLRSAIVWMCNRRKQYIYLFEILGINNELVIQNLIKKLNYSITQWEAFMNLIKYFYFKNEYVIGIRGVKFIEDILLSDDDLFSFFKVNKKYLYEAICSN